MLESDFPDNHFEGLNAPAIDLWRKWLRLYQDKFQGFEYNVRVGQGLDPGPNATDEMRRMWKMLTTKRIDVVAARQNQTWVIEIEPRPGMRTLGQLVGYMGLIGKYYPVRDVLVGALVAEYVGYDMFGLFHDQDHLIFKFQPGHKPSLPPQFLPTTASDQYTVANQ